MATNKGACSKDMAGTDTLIGFIAVSAEKVGAVSNNEKTIKETRMARRFIVHSFAKLVRPDYPKQEKMSSWVLQPSRSFFKH